MRFNKIIFSTGIIMFACTPLPQSTTNNNVSTDKSTTSTTTTSPPKKVEIAFEKYTAHPSAGKVLSNYDLSLKKLDESVPTTGHSGVYRLKLNNPTPEVLAEVSKCYNLQELTLKYGSYAEIPKSLFKLKNLTSLDITSTRIVKVPNEIGNLTNIRKLRLAINNPRGCDISGLANLKSLKVLKLQDAGINALPDFEKLTELEEVHLLRTKATKVPTSLVKCKKMRFLNLESNSVLTTLPNDLKDIESLEVVTKKNAIDPSTCRDLIRIKKLGRIQINPYWGDYSYNKTWKEIEEYPTQVFDLYFASFKEEELTRFWSVIPKLTSLNRISGNIPSASAICDLNNLKHLTEIKLGAKADVTIEMSQLKKVKSLNIYSPKKVTLNIALGLKMDELSLKASALTLNNEVESDKLVWSNSKISSSLSKVKSKSLTLDISSDPIVCPANWASFKMDTVKFGSISDIKVLPANFCSNNNIVGLDLIGSKGVTNVNFEKVPNEIANMSGLRALKLPMSSIPSVVYKMTQLESLVFNHPEGIKKLVIPADIKNLVNLKEFSYSTLVGLGTIVIDPSFYNLPKLEELTLYNCRKSLSVTHFNLSESVSNLKLKKLVLNTPFKVPNSVWSIPTLEHLEIYSLKEHINVTTAALPNLKYFRVEDEGAKIPFESLGSIEHLSVNIGQSTSIQNVFTLKKLKYLRCYEHNFDVNDVNKLNNLETAYFKFCKIGGASTGRFNLPKLQSFTATGCALTTVPKFDSPKIKNLDLSYNKGITKLNGEFYDLTTLNTIDFNSTQISGISNEYENLTSINKVWFKKAALTSDDKSVLRSVDKIRNGLRYTKYF